MTSNKRTQYDIIVPPHFTTAKLEGNKEIDKGARISNGKTSILFKLRADYDAMSPMDVLILLTANAQAYLTNGKSDPKNTCGIAGTDVFKITSKNDFNTIANFDPPRNDFYRYLKKSD